MDVDKVATLFEINVKQWKENIENIITEQVVLVGRGVGFIMGINDFCPFYPPLAMLMVHKCTLRLRSCLLI